MQLLHEDLLCNCLNEGLLCNCLHSTVCVKGIHVAVCIRPFRQLCKFFQAVVCVRCFMQLFVWRLLVHLRCMRTATFFIIKYTIVHYLYYLSASKASTFTFLVFTFSSPLFFSFDGMLTAHLLQIWVHWALFHAFINLSKKTEQPKY